MALVAVGSRFAKSLVDTPLAVVDVGNAIAQRYDTDAHFYLYHLRLDGVPVSNQPRVRKADVGEDGSLGAHLVCADVIAADVDEPGHAPHADDALAVRRAGELEALCQSAGVYVTTRGWRLVQPLSRPLCVTELEPVIRGWYHELSRLGVAVDWATTDWTRCFRLAHVVRDGRRYHCPAVLTSRMRPIAPPTPAGGARSVRRGQPVAGVAFVAELPAAHDALARTLAAAVRQTQVPDGEGGWHRLFLRLAGALCSRRLVAPEVVPAFVRLVARLAGDRLVDDRAKAARTTAQRWLGRLELDTRLADYPLVAAVLGPAEPAHPPAAVRAAQSGAEASRKLEEAIRSAPDGLTVIQSPCGAGKTRAVRIVAAERALRAGRANVRTSIAVPTTELAEQITADLRAAGVAVRRIFGPLSVRGPYDGWECRVHANAAALAVGQQSVQKIFCRSCPYRPDCKAVDGADGPSDARVVVGPHALVLELAAAAGKTGLLFLDEPPNPLEEYMFNLDELARAPLDLAWFDSRFAACMAPLASVVASWVTDGPVRAPGPLARALDRGVDAGLLDAALTASGTANLEDAMRATMDRPGGPPLTTHAKALAHARTDPTDLARVVKIGRASRLFAALHWAATSAAPSPPLTVIYEGDDRVLVITGLDRRLESALRREGPTIVAAADAHLRLATYQAIVGGPPRVVEIDAAAGAAIDRTWIHARANRAAWKNPAARARAWSLAVDWVRKHPQIKRLGVVTYLAQEAHARAAFAALGEACSVVVSHYGAVRGLDAWTDFDAVATLGDPWPNLDASERAGVLARNACVAELEQAHGRLRPVHRQRPGWALHVGQVSPGWPGSGVPFGRPRHARLDLADLAALVERAGGRRAVQRALGITSGSLDGWLSGRRPVPQARLAWLRTAARQLSH